MGTRSIPLETGFDVRGLARAPSWDSKVDPVEWTGRTVKIALASQLLRYVEPQDPGVYMLVVWKVCIFQCDSEGKIMN